METSLGKDESRVLPNAPQELGTSSGASDTAMFLQTAKTPPFDGPPQAPKTGGSALEWTKRSDELTPEERFFPFPQQKLRESLEKCIVFLSQHEGKTHTEEFWQFMSLLCVKLYEERTPGCQDTGFRATPAEYATDEGMQEIFHRIETLYSDAQRAYPGAFAGKALTLSPRSVAYVVNELQTYTVSATLLDPFSVVYQQWNSVVSRSSRGQFFSPLSAVLFAIRLLDPQEHERVLDYTCGAGAFIGGLYAHRAESLGLTFALGAPPPSPDGEPLARLGRYMQTQVYGSEIDSALVEVARTQMAMTGGDTEHIYWLDSLAFPTGEREDSRAHGDIPLGSLDALLGNPPFRISMSLDPAVLKGYELAHRWTSQADGEFHRQGTLNKRVSLAVLFLERALAWLRPGGRLALIVPSGILGSPGDQYARDWMMKRLHIQAVVDLPVETFQAETGTHTQTSILLARKLTESEMPCNPDYKIFMAVAASVGYDSRGRIRYKRDAEGEKVLHHGRPVVDNDLPLVLQHYRRFLSAYTTRVLVHVPSRETNAFQQTVEMTFGLRSNETFRVGTTEETQLLLYTVWIDPQESYERFHEFLTREKEGGIIRNFAPVLRHRGTVGVNPVNGHLLQFLLPEKP